MNGSSLHWLLHGMADGESSADVWRWWRQRRFAYNLLVGSVGLFSWLSVLIAGSAAAKPGVDFEEPIAMIAGPPMYCVMATLCYTIGPMFDALTRHKEPSKRLFAAGLIFSVVLTASAGIWAIVAWLTTVVTAKKLD